MHYAKPDFSSGVGNKGYYFSASGYQVLTGKTVRRERETVGQPESQVRESTYPNIFVLVFFFPSQHLS